MILFSVGLLNRVAIRIEEEPIGTLLGLAMEIILVVLAADAYRMARRSLRERLAGRSGEDALESKEMLTLDLDKPSLPQEPQSPAEDPLSIVGGARLPLALAGLFFLGYWTLILAGLLMPDYETMDQSQVEINELEEGGKVYSNPEYGVQFRVPEGWEIDLTDTDYLLQITTLGGACHVGLMIDSTFPFYGPQNTANDLVEEIQTNYPNFQLQDRRSATLATLPAHEVVFQAEVEGSDVGQSYLIAHHGSTVFTLITTMAGGFEELCGEDAESIRENLDLGS